MKHFSFCRSLLFSYFFLAQALAQDVACSVSSECVNGACCSITPGEPTGICGYGDFCTTNCVSNCDAKAECGEYAEPINATCPLNVCCSPYGFCGVGSDYCSTSSDNSMGHGCQSNCESPIEPSCGSSNDVMRRIIGYYESWASSRSCDSWRPGDIAASSLTHLNWAFALFEPSTDDDDEWYFYFPQDETGDTASLLTEFIDLKETNPGLSLFVSIGGWAFNDDYPTYWSDMASTEAGRQSFSKNLLEFLQGNGFDGADLDWEYPVASDRGGNEADKGNYGLLIKEIRKTFDASGKTYGLSFTIPSSYWYLKNFDVVEYLAADGADWANVMTYDLHGVWDGHDPWIGNIVEAHTNLTEISSAVDLLWRVGVDPSQIVIGMGFYGRSFTLSDTACIDPGCNFKNNTGGREGQCTQTSGILSYKEIKETIDSSGSVPVWDKESAVNYMTWDNDQWISYDDERTFQQKVDWANNHCLGGVMIWAIDQDTYDWQALSGLLNKTVDGSSLLKGGTEDNKSAEERAAAYSAYTGTQCYISSCVDYNKGQCKSGYSVLDYVHGGSLGAIKAPDDDQCTLGSTYEAEDTSAQYRLICCPTDNMPKGCTWQGGSHDGLCTGDGTCGEGKYELVTDSYDDRTGSIECLINHRSLCCNTNPELEKCSWTACGGSCAEGYTQNDYTSSYGGTNLDQDSELCTNYGISYFCCPNESPPPCSKPEKRPLLTYPPDPYKNCEWNTDCDATSCLDNKVLITRRTQIEYFHTMEDPDVEHLVACNDGYAKYCCDPPDATTYWPVDPKYLFEYPDEDNVSWYYEDELTASDATEDGSAGDSDDSHDPFAFVMIDGDTDAYDESLVDQWEFLNDDHDLFSRDETRKRKRDIFRVCNDTFVNEQEWYRIRCVSNTGCKSIFSEGASNTIVKMPSDRGAGPYARVVNLVLEGPTESNSDLRARSNEVYHLTVDYNLAAASEEEKGDVNFRIDYTNLLEYWNSVTDIPSSKRRKRWFGDFDSWLQKLTTMVAQDKSYLPLEYDETVKLFHFDKTCGNVHTTMDLDANIHLGLGAQYAYYFEGAILPSPSLIAAYGYFSVEPTAAILMTLRGEATIQTDSDPVEIISGITFPGLSIKGLISIGPELALNGSVDASLSISGELNAGVSVGWDRFEVYFPQDAAGNKASVAPGTLQAATDRKKTYSVQPDFDASLSAEGNLALTLTPEVKFGISVLGGDLMSGYVTAGVENTISMGISATASTGTDGTTAGFCYWADYVYNVFLRADVSFIGGLEYWGDEYDVASPDDPIELVAETCISYNSTKTQKLHKRGGSLVENTDKSGLCSGFLSCDTNLVSNNTCTSLDPDTPVEACTFPPALFYNCDFSTYAAFENLNENTMAENPRYWFEGICENIRNYLEDNIETGRVGPNWMMLTYLTGGKSSDSSSNNRADACGKKRDECAKSKSEMWPLSVQSKTVTTTVKGVAMTTSVSRSYTEAKKSKLSGFSDNLSCDEFPFNASEEGGTGAEVACVDAAQQDYQKKVNNLISNIYENDTPWTAKSWAKGASNTRKFTINLFSWSSDGNNIDSTYAGTFKSSSTTGESSLQWVVGGVNLPGNPNFKLAKKGDMSNAVCVSRDREMANYGSRNIMEYKLVSCQVEFETAADLVSRGLDPLNSDNWSIKSVHMYDEDAVPLKGLNDSSKWEAFEEADFPKNYPPGAAITPPPKAEEKF